MPSYQIQAPNGKTYVIDGPANATQEQVRAQVLAQHPDAGIAQSTQTLKAAPSRLESFIGDVKGITEQRMAEADKEIEAAKAMPFSMVNPLASLQSMGANFKGALAPAYGVGAAIGRAVDQTYGKPGSAGGEDVKYGQLAEALVPIPAEKLVAPARAGGAAIAKALGNAAPSGQMVAQSLKSVGPKIGSFFDAGAKTAAENVRASAIAKIMEHQEALANAQKAVETGKLADKTLRPAMEAKAAEKAAQDIGVSDIPEAQQLVADLQSRLNPNSPVATIPNADQIKSYQKVINVLQPSKGSKPNLETVQNLRRELATAYNGDQTGYAAIPKETRKELVKSLNEIENVYTEGLQAPVQENYTALIAAQKQAKQLEKISPDVIQASIKIGKSSPQDSVKIAQSIVDKMQKRGMIPENEYEDFVALAQNAKDAKGKSAFRKKLLLFGAGAVGLSTAPGREILHTIGVP
jgi:hypothetical protein